MLALAVVLFVPQALKTFEELEIAKLEEYHKLEGYREEMEMKMGGAVYKKISMLDGKRYRVSIILPNGAAFDSISNGTTTWALVHSDKGYYQSDIDKSYKFNAKEKLLKVEENSFRFNFDSNLPIQFASNPPLKIDKIDKVTEGKEELRRVIASGASSSGRRLTVTQWFLPNRWVLKRFTIEGQGQDGPVEMSAEVTKMEFKAKFVASDFEVAPDILKSYRNMGAGQN